MTYEPASWTRRTREDPNCQALPTYRSYTRCRGSARSAKRSKYSSMKVSFGRSREWARLY